MSTARRWVPTRHAFQAFGGGLLLAFSLPPWGWWPLAVAGIVLLDFAIADAPFWARFRRAWLTGVGLLAPSTVWMVAFTPPGYLVQVVAYSAFLGLFVGCCPPNRWRWLALPGAWVLFEALKGRWPFGGVPLSELAIGQVSGPLAAAARTGGVLLIGMLTVAAGVAVAAAIRRAWVPAAIATGLVLLVVGGSAVAPRGYDTGERITVAYVQGGGEQGTTDEETDDREVFLAHLDATRAVPEGTDLIVWPENVVNVDYPLDEVPEGDEMAAMAKEKQATLVAGIVEADGPDHFRNYSLVYGPDGKVVGRYDKVRRVPFGEYVPLRGLLETVAGDALPSKDAIAGDDSNTVDTPAGRLGIVISWEVFFSDRGRDAVNGRGRPAELLLNPTNGSSYSGTLVQSQQIGSSRLRALETGRWVVQSAPTGFSAFVTDTGEVLDRSAVSERRVEVREVPLREGRTLFLRWGLWPPLLLAIGLVIAANLASRARSTPDDEGRLAGGASGRGPVTDRAHSDPPRVTSPTGAADEARRRADLARMKRTATGLLVLATAVFLVTQALEDTYSWLAYVRATAEAAMVGAIADWFAVTALFRHPLGIPIPHTAIIPNRKDDIGRGLGTFVQQNFLTRAVVEERLAGAGVATRLGAWLAEPSNAEQVGSQVGGVIRSTLETLRDEEIQESLENAVAAKVRSIEAGPILARGIELAMADGRHQELLSVLLRRVGDAVVDNEELLRDRMQQETPWWVPERVDDRLFDRVHTGVQRFLHEVADDPEHPMRHTVDQRMSDLADQLARSPAMRARAEELKEELIDHPALRDWSSGVWADVKRSLLDHSADPDSELRRRIVDSVRSFGERLRDDPSLQANVDAWIASTAIELVERSKGEVGEVIASTVARWDATDATARIELQVGRDLQFIRINGTVVGGLAGLVIYSVGQLLG